MYINIRTYFTKMLMFLLSASLIMQNSIIFAQKIQPNKPKKGHQGMLPNGTMGNLGKPKTNLRKT